MENIYEVGYDNANGMDIQTIEISGIKGAIIGARKSFRSVGDSKFESSFIGENGSYENICKMTIGEKDMDLMRKLIKTGRGSEQKFLRCIHVQADITAPLSWWKQFDTYKVATVRLSDSTMHNICKRPFNPEDFAANTILNNPLKLNYAGEATTRTIFSFVIQTLNMLRDEWFKWKNLVLDQEFIDTYGQEKFDEAVAKRKWNMDTIWRQIIDILPDSYLMNSIVDLNYANIRAMYFDREGHKLAEWHHFMHWADELPFGLVNYTGETTETSPIPAKNDEKSDISDVKEAKNDENGTESEPEPAEQPSETETTDENNPGVDGGSEENS